MQTKIPPLLATTSFQKAMEEKNFPILDVYLTKIPDLLNIPDEKGITPLGYAVKDGDIKLTKWLLQYGDPLIQLSHIDLAYKAYKHVKVRKYLRHQLEKRYKELDYSSDELKIKQAKMVLAANLSLYFHYGMADFTGMESFARKELDYIIKAEKLFEEIVQENEWNFADLIDLHLKMGKVCLLLGSGGVTKHYSFLVEKQNGLLKNQGYQKTLVENLGDNLIILVKNHLKHGESFEPGSSSLANQYACESYFKVLQIADSTPDCMFGKQKSIICYYAGLACRYIGECYQMDGDFRESLIYYLKSMEANSNILNWLSPDLNKEHTSIVEELARGYRQLYLLHQKGDISLMDIQMGLKVLDLNESKEAILAKKATFDNEALIARFYEAFESVHGLLENNVTQNPTPFWTKQNHKIEAISRKIFVGELGNW